MIGLIYNKKSPLWRFKSMLDTKMGIKLNLETAVPCGVKRLAMYSAVTKARGQGYRNHHFKQPDLLSYL
jgi:hypothetical protein